MRKTLFFLLCATVICNGMNQKLTVPVSRSDRFLLAWVKREHPSGWEGAVIYIERGRSGGVPRNFLGIERMAYKAKIAYLLETQLQSKKHTE